MSDDRTGTTASGSVPQEPAKLYDELDRESMFNQPLIAFPWEKSEKEGRYSLWRSHAKKWVTLI
jgi:hypothetical protein